MKLYGYVTYLMKHNACVYSNSLSLATLPFVPRTGQLIIPLTNHIIIIYKSSISLSLP